MFLPCLIEVFYPRHVLSIIAGSSDTIRFAHLRWEYFAPFPLQRGSSVKHVKIRLSTIGNYSTNGTLSLLKYPFWARMKSQEYFFAKSGQEHSYSNGGPFVWEKIHRLPLKVSVEENSILIGTYFCVFTPKVTGDEKSWANRETSTREFRVLFCITCPN